VRLLASLLRVADALDKEHRQKIQGIAVVKNGTEVRIRASGADDVLLEQWALKKKNDLFRDVFGLDVTLSRDGASSDG
jgi:exopolyphosphatase/guanosine-5'-triphosphate,3'-diphosphate pyrophosphatase